MYILPSHIVTRSLVAAEEEGRIRSRRWRIAQKNGEDDTLSSLTALRNFSKHVSLPHEALLTCTMYVRYQLSQTAVSVIFYYI